MCSSLLKLMVLGRLPSLCAETAVIALQCRESMSLLLILLCKPIEIATKIFTTEEEQALGPQICEGQIVY